MSFALHPQLAKDTFIVSDLPFCRVLLMNNRHFPWLILVPRRANLREIFDLLPEDYQTAMAEVRQVSNTFAELHRAHKMNIAALGNVVPQLHIYIIARFENDVAWPNPVWDSPSEPYEKNEAVAAVAALQKALNL